MVEFQVWKIKKMSQETIKLTRKAKNKWDKRKTDHLATPWIEDLTVTIIKKDQTVLGEKGEDDMYNKDYSLYDLTLLFQLSIFHLRLVHKGLIFLFVLAL